MPLKIIQLSTSGFRSLKATEIVFDEGVNVIQGATRQGKTSVIEDLFLSFKGLRGQARDLIPHGETTSENVVKFTNDGVEYEITRVIQQNGAPTLELRELIPGSKSRKRSAPQAFLNNLLPAMGETPVTFLKKSANEKTKFILERHETDVSDEQKKIADAKTKKDELVIQQKLYAAYEHTPKPSENSAKKQEIQKKIDAVAGKNKEVTDKYTRLKTEKSKAFTKNSTEYKEYKAKLEDLAPDENNLITDKAAANAEHVALKKLEQELADRKVKHKAEIARIATEQTRIEIAKASIPKAVEPDYTKHLEELAALNTKEDEEKEDSSALESELAAVTAEDTASETYLAGHKEWNKKAEEIAKADAEYKAAKTALKTKLAAIPCKLEGLEIAMDEETRPDGVYLEGIFSEEWSGAEGLLAASKILKRYNNQEVLIIDGGECIHNDQKAFKAFCEWARADKVQVIISVVSEAPDDEEADRVLFIENGGVQVIR